MNRSDYRNITNSFRDVQLISLHHWAMASEIQPQDHGGPYVITQLGFDPEDLTFTPDEFVLGRSGMWLSLSYFFQMSVPARRAEFVFGTSAEVMSLMSLLPSAVRILRPDTEIESPKSDDLVDEMRQALEAGEKTWLT
jgi:hypothetical protein